MNTRFKLKYKSPFKLDYTIWALRRSSKNFIDRWENGIYTRVYIIDNAPIKVDIKQEPYKNQILIYVDKKIGKTKQIKLSQLVRLSLNLQLAMNDFYQLAMQDRHIKLLVAKFLGMKPPCFPSLFEAIVNSISCQQISLDAGLQIQNRLAQYVGKSILDNTGTFYSFPLAIDIANCQILELKKLGYTRHKSEALIEIASASVLDKLQLETLKNKSSEEAIRFLCQFKGIGRWSAEYILLRGLKKFEIFPEHDIGALNTLQNFLNLENKISHAESQKIIEKWYPYAGIIYMHLLLYKLNKKGII